MPTPFSKMSICSFKICLELSKDILVLPIIDLGFCNAHFGPVIDLGPIMHTLGQ